MADLFTLREAINSVALSHDEDCGCLTCKAASGDQAALAELLVELQSHRLKRER